VLALFVRFTDPAAVRAPVRLMASARELGLVRVHHRVFYAILLTAPIEWVLRGRPAAAVQLAGALLFAAGVGGYRRAGGALGSQLSPLVAPREPARLVDGGPYRRVRHPMYLAELAMAAGAPVLLGARLTALLALVFAAVVVRRITMEEELLRTRVPEYEAYASRTYRLVPYVY
jgi:protein-S-isoprenylcysteine O-methyltransferase Ste14